MATKEIWTEFDEFSMIFLNVSGWFELNNEKLLSCQLNVQWVIEAMSKYKT